MTPMSMDGVGLNGKGNKTRTAPSETYDGSMHLLYALAKQACLLLFRQILHSSVKRPCYVYMKPLVAVLSSTFAGLLQDRHKYTYACR